MPIYHGLIGPTADSRSVGWSDELTINQYVVLAEAGTPKSPAGLHHTPGNRPFSRLGANAIRTMFHQDGRMFAISGSSLYEIGATGSPTFLGSVAVDAWPATISSSGTAGNQLLITSGGLGYILDLLTNVLTQITDAGFPTHVRSGIYFAGYFIVLHSVEGTFHLSELHDGFEWNALNFGTDTNASDLIRAMWRTHDLLWLFGTKHSTPWFNSGSSSFAFKPVQGTLIEQGIGTIWSIASLDNTIFWVGMDEHGHGMVWRANGYTPMRISTSAIEKRLQQLPTIEDGIGWAYQEDGHLFYVLRYPSARTSLVYDVKTNLWHERALWDTHEIRWHPHVGRNHVFAFGKHLVGDAQSGTIYEQSLAFPFEDLTIIGSLSSSGLPLS